MDSSNTTIKPTFSQRYTTFFHAVLFVLGFSLVFIIGWGGAATLLGRVFGEYKQIIARIGGLVIIIFGLNTLGVLKIPWLAFYSDTRPQFQVNRKNMAWSSLMMGVIFAAGWTPCVGTTLGAILTLGFAQNTSGQAMVLASGYALGLAIPFLIIGLGMNRAVGALRKLRPHMRKIQIASGVLLILIGLMLVTNRLTFIAIWAQQNGFYLDLPLGDSQTPTYLIAMLAGLLSFLSPCVLPLVPAYIGFLSGQAFASES
ncbi:MAG: cytochrome C biogenesis protein [Anaerolineae bacterium]|nr:cytochrome C biogenesis protein [Anaerolineae bacterium]